MNTSNIITSITYHWIELKNRIKANEPLYFTKLKTIIIRVVLASVAVITVNSTLTLGLPVALITVLSYIIAAGVGVYGTTILTKEKE